VLICPGCQAAFDWTSDLDHCPVCSSVHLVRRLGEAECRDCGSVRQPVTSSLPGHLAALAGGSPAAAGSAASGAPGPAGPVGPEAGSGAAEGLAQEVERALARVLGRTAGSAARG
jgi:hypothetical protein